MIKPSSVIEDSNEKAIGNFENIRESLKGLYEILMINFSENDIYFKIASDNLVALYQNFLELTLSENGPKIIKRKLRNCELELDIPLGTFTINGESAGDKKIDF
jgi:hypothetical protein